MKTITDECRRCGAEYQQEVSDWVYEDGQPVSGFNGKDWYRSDHSIVDLDAPNVKVVQQRVYGYGAVRDICEKCEEHFYRQNQENVYFNSPLAPDWFDPTYAGEEW